MKRQSADEIFYCKWIGNTLAKRYQTHDKSAEVETRIFAYWTTGKTIEQVVKPKSDEEIYILLQMILQYLS